MSSVEFLLDAIRRLSEAGDMETVTGIVKVAARKLSGADGATFILRENDLCYYADEDAISHLWKGKRFAMGNCISGWVMQNREPAVIEDIYQDKRIPVDTYQPTFVKSLAMVPIRSTNAMGAIGIYWGRNYTASPAELEMLQSLADSTAVAIEKIKVLSKYNQTIDELKKQNKAKALHTEKIKGFSRIFEELLDEIYIFDAQTLRFVFANKGAIKNIGFTPKELLKLTPVDIKPEFDKQSFLEALRPLVEEKTTTLVLETVHRRKNNSTYPVEVHIHKSIFDLKEVFVAIVLDITERQQNEEKLRRSESELKKAQQITHIGSWFLDLETNEVTWTEELYKMYGFDPALPPPPYSEHMKLFTPDSWEALSVSLARTIETGIPYELELRTVRDDGTNGWMWVRGETIHDATGKIVALWGAAQDISERKKIEEELIKAKKIAEENEIRYRALHNASFGGIAIHDKGLILECNQGLSEMTGYSVDELIGMDGLLLISEETRDLIKSKIAAGYEKPYEAIGVRKNGGEYPLRIESRNILYQGKPVRVTEFRDITEQKQAEIQIEKHKSELEEYFENDISADYVVSADGEIFSCNKTFIEMFGFDRKTQTPRFNITQLYRNPNDRQKMVSLVKKCGKVENFEVDFVSRDGKTINAIINAIGIFDTAGNLEKIRGYIVDISKQKITEKELHGSEEKYRLLFANNPQPMWIYDLETLGFLEVNEAAIHHYGYSSEEFLSMTLKDIRPAEDIPALLKDVEQTLSKLSTTGVWRHVKKNGEIISVEITSHSVLYNNRRARHVLINDITERKRTEKELLKLSHAVEQSPLSIVITDTKGIIEFINPGFTRITGYTAMEVKGENPRVLQSGETAAEVYKELWETIAAGKIWMGEFHNRKKNGELYWESATIAPIFDEKGEIINYIAIKEDITKQKELIQQLIQSKEKAEESDRLKSSFLANMSHEIRTPMNSILGFTELMLEPELSSEQKEEYIKIVNHSGQRMLNTVNDIVAISIIEAGIANVDLKDVNVHERLNELIRCFTPEATQKGLKLVLDNGTVKTTFVITTDQNKLDSILTNLIKNAIRYTPAGEIRVGSHIKGNMLEFYVKDSGTGIPAEKQQAIFERFIQAEMGGKDARQGSGLGLAITKAYVEMLGGEIRLESKIGEGSTFYFTLPLGGHP